MSVRRIQFGGAEHQSREIHALHEHHADSWSWYGNGQTVLVVNKKPGRGRSVICEVHGEDGTHALGGEFRYEDYFLPEERALSEEAQPTTTPALSPSPRRAFPNV